MLQEAVSDGRNTGLGGINAMEICYIVGAGEFCDRDFNPREGDFIIAADGGYVPLYSLGVKPDLLLGDFDSLCGVPLPSDVPTVRYPVMKDDTDMGLALEAGWERGFRTFHIYGGGGGRLDHLLANIQSMGRYAKRGAAMRLVGMDYDVYTVANGTLTLPARPRGTLISVFCHGDEAQGVTLEGLLYPLNQAALTCDVPLGVSNQALGGPVRVTVKRGTVTVLAYLRAQDAPRPPSG